MDSFFPCYIVYMGVRLLRLPCGSPTRLGKRMVSDDRCLQSCQRVRRAEMAFSIRRRPLGYASLLVTTFRTKAGAWYFHPCVCVPEDFFLKRRSWEGVLSPIETLLRSSLNFALFDLSSLERIASFSTSNCFSVGGCSRISSISSAISLGRASTTCVNIIRCEVILQLEKMVSSWWNHTLGLFVLKDGTRRLMEFWTSADNKFFSASRVLNVLSKK